MSDQTERDQAERDQTERKQTEPEQTEPEQAERDQVEQWPGAAGPPGADPDVLDAQLRAEVARLIAERPATVAADPWRQAFHIQPPVGLLNDPNGLVWHDGVYHLCYQWHPNGPEHGLKYWAHLTSTDLVHWSEQPLALAPSQPYETHGCYSGCGIVHDGAVHFLYTGNVRTPDGGRLPLQALARLGADGVVVKDPANPLVGLLPGCSSSVRDPKVWQQDGRFWMVLGAQTEDKHGTAALLSSPDLVQWTLLGTLGGGADDPVGGYMWECPDLLRLPGGDVLVISAQYDLGEVAAGYRWVDRTEYAVGRLSLDPPGFARSRELTPMDAGPDFYAPQTFTGPDGRLLLVGWMGMPDGADHPPLAVKHPTATNGWVHCLTVPRTVDLVDGTLVQQPVAELAALHGDAVAPDGMRLLGGTSTTIPGVDGACLDLDATVQAAPGAHLVIRFRDGAAGRPACLVIDPAAGVARLDRTLLGTGEGGVWSGTFRPGGSVDVRVLLDQSSLEVFIDSGRLVLSARIYPVAGDEQVTFQAEGGDVGLSVTAWPMLPA